MKKIALFVFTIVIAAAFGIAYAGEVSNGITNFAGKYINTLGDLYPADSSAMPSAVESSNAGGMRSADLGIEKLNNGISDFTGRSYDSPSDLGAAVPGAIHGAFVKSTRLPEVVTAN
jgi:hypothetical protein